MSKLAFQFHAERDNRTTTAHIYLYFYRYDEGKYLGDEVLEVSVQNDPTNKCWYGLTYKANAKSPEALAQAARLATRLDKAIKAAHESAGVRFSYWDGMNPLLVVEAARTLAVLVVHDDRSGHWLSPDKVPPPDWVAYSEDWEAAGLSGFYERVILPADRESRARDVILKRMAEDGQTERIAKWAKAGFPVKVWDSKYPPNVEPPDKQIERVEWRGE